MEVINVIAILLSPLIALLISQHIQDKKELNNRQFQIFLSLISSRHAILTEDQIKAYNSIDVIFSDSNNVRRVWKEYFDLLHQKERQAEWTKKKLELLKEMANVVGYKDSIDHLDLDRIYCPTGMLDREEAEARLLQKWETFLDSAAIIKVEKKIEQKNEKHDMFLS